MNHPALATSPVSLALVGCGAVSRLFYQPALRELQRHGMVNILAVVDPRAEARAPLAAAFGAAACAMLDEALALRPELIVIATPPALHRTQAEAAFSANCAVLCEKPLAANADDADAIVTAAARTGRLLAAGHYKRFMPAHRAIKTLIERETFGPLLEATLVEGGKFSWPAATDSFFKPEQTPGGVLLDIGVHTLDLLRWWLNDPVDFTYADDALDGLEANALLLATFASGAKVRLRLSRDWRTENVYVFRFARATVHSRVNASNQLEITLDGLPMTLAAELREPLPISPAPPSRALETNPQAFIAQLVDVCAALRENRSPFVPGAEGAHALRWIERCYAHRTTLPLH